MLAEFLVLASLIVIGGLVMLAVGFHRPLPLVFGSLPVGAALVVTIALVSGAVGLPLHPLWLLGVSFVVAGAAAFRSRTGTPAWSWLFPLGGVALAAGVTRLLHGRGYIHLTPDSFWYLSMGSVMARGGSIRLGDGRALQERGIGLPALHSLGDLAGDYYLHTLAPLMALSLAGLIVWIGHRAIDAEGRRIQAWVLPVLSAALVFTNANVIFHVFYINSHVVFAAWLLLVVGVLWLVARGTFPQRRAWLAVVIAPALAILRPEAAITLLVALVVPLSSDRLSTRVKAALAGVTGAATVTWHLVVALQMAEGPGLEVWGMLAVGTVALAVAAGFVWRGDWVPASAPKWAAGALLIGLAGLAILDSEFWTETWRSTASNLSVGGPYGSLIVVVGVASILALLRRRTGLGFLVFPVLTAVPLGLTFSFLRGIPYRTGAGDSFSRMLLHWLPLALVGALATVGPMSSWRPTRKPASQHGSAVISVTGPVNIDSE